MTTTPEVLPHLVAVPAAALAGFAAEAARAQAATWAVWPRDSDGGLLDVDGGTRVELEVAGGTLPVHVLTVDLNSLHARVADLAWSVAEQLPGETWPAGACPGAGPGDVVVEAAGLTRVTADVCAWREAAAQLPVPADLLAPALAALDHLAGAVPVPVGPARPAVLPPLPAPSPAFPAQVLADTIAALRTFAAANAVAHMAGGHGKSWEPVAAVRAHPDGKWHLQVHSYQFASRAGVPRRPGAPARALRDAQQLATRVLDALPARVAAADTHTGWQVPTVAQVLADPEMVYPAPQLDGLAGAVDALTRAGHQVTLGFAPAGAFSVEVPSLDQVIEVHWPQAGPADADPGQVQPSGHAALHLQLRRLLALAAQR